MPRVSLPPLLSVSVVDELTRNGITPSLSKSEIMVKSVRIASFAETKSKGLCIPAAAIRRDTAACPISAKLSHDICDCLKKCTKNSNEKWKRDRITSEASQASHASTISGPLLESSPFRCPWISLPHPCHLLGYHLNRSYQGKSLLHLQ